MNPLVSAAADSPPTTLHAELRTLITSSRQRLAGAVNAELTRLYWSVGERLRTEVLGGADRAKYGDQLIQRVGEQLAQEFGRGFEAKNLRRMVQFAQAFPLPEIVATLSRQLSWSHFVKLLPRRSQNRGRTPVLRQPSDVAPIELSLRADFSCEQVGLQQMSKEAKPY